MDQNRLLLLGLLKAQDQHGYQIIEFVERNLAAMTNLKKGTAYYELKQLEKQRLVSVRTEQEVGRPPRRVYSLTPEGAAAFAEMLREALREADPLAPATDTALMFMDWLPADEVCDLLEQRLAGLRQFLLAYRGAPSHGPHSSVDIGIEHAAARLTMEISWHEHLIERLKARVSHG